MHQWSETIVPTVRPVHAIASAHGALRLLGTSLVARLPLVMLRAGTLGGDEPRALALAPA